MRRFLPNVALLLFAAPAVLVTPSLRAAAQEATASQVPPTDSSAATDPNKKTKPAPVKPIEIGSIRNVHQCGTLLLAGQPTEADLALLKERGVQRIVSYRTEGEVQWDQAGAISALGMEFIELPYGTIDSLTDEIFDKSRKLFAEHQSEPLFVHCGVATRVAAVWLPYRVLDEKVPLEQALQEAEAIGLSSKALRERALQYIRDQRQPDPSP